MTRQSTLGAFGLTALAVGGYACSLRLIDVRPYAVFQHYQTWHSLIAGRPMEAWLLAGQAAIVGAVAWGMRDRLSGAASVLPWRAWLVLLAVTGFSLAVPTESAGRTLGEIVLAGGLAAVAATNLVLAVMLLPDDAVSRAVAWVNGRVTLSGDGAARPWDRVLPMAAALWVVLLSALISVIVLERVPHIDDSISNLFQAKYFATGHLYLPAPPDAASFQVDQTVVADGKWFGYAFPAWPAVLAIGVWLGVPWLVNPVLAGVLILLAYGLIRRRSTRGTANVAVLLLALSPWLLFMSAEFMAHPLGAVLVVLAALAFDHAAARERGWLGWGVIAGAAAGALVLTRAIDAAIVAGALAGTLVVDRRLVRALPAVVVAGIVAAGIAALALPYNRAVTGKATYPPHMAWSDSHWGPGVDRLGFGPDIGIRQWPNLDPLPGHGPADVVLNANKNAFMTHVDLFGWASGSLVFIGLGLGLGRWRRGDALMFALPVCFIAGYSAYWFSGGPDLGARYWYPLIVPFAALTARGIEMVAQADGTRDRSGTGAGRVAAWVIAASLSAAFVMVPWRAVTKHYRYRGISGEIRELAASRHFDHALVFVRADANRRDFASAFNLNPVTLDDPATIYALDAGPDHIAAVARYFSDRQIWVIGRPAQGQPIDVIEGPLPPGSLPR